MPCVCSILGTCYELCSRFGLCVVGSDSRIVGTCGLRCLSWWGLSIRGPCGLLWACFIWPKIPKALASPCSTVLLPPSKSYRLLNMENLPESDGRFLLPALFFVVSGHIWVLKTSVLPCRFAFRGNSTTFQSSSSLVDDVFVVFFTLIYHWFGNFLSIWPNRLHPWHMLPSIFVLNWLFMFPNEYHRL